MGKLTNYLIIMSGIILLFYIGGLLEGTASSTLLSLVLNPDTLSTTEFYIAIGSVITAALAAAAAVIWTRTSLSDFYVMIPLIGLFFSFGWDFLVIHQTISASSTIGGVVSLLFFGPIMLGYLMAVIEWWRGVST